ncbi:hypothetical protein ACIHCV_28610 [Streptomyces sp. NPDC051956]|uniref:hypothetical protein n=1 Tax=Streptomyces sp. NPDC051956 TaxID=3365677 RepID=UPI0037CCF428
MNGDLTRHPAYGPDPYRQGPYGQGPYGQDVYGRDAYEHDPFEDDAAAGTEDGYFALELELLELACIQEAALVHTTLPDVGETVFVAFVPLSAEQESAGARAVRAACQRCLPWLFAYVVAVDSIERDVEGAVRAELLLDRGLPQIARDLASPVAMSD